MRVVNVGLGTRSYPIVIGNGIAENLTEHLPGSGKVAIVTTPVIHELYSHLLNSIDRDYLLLVVPDGEDAKEWEKVEKVLGKLLENGFDRKSTIVALGGGTVGDLAGFVASIYMRGIDVIQVPTTLLAMVDSSIGGKTAVNHPRGKNLVGAFHQPSKVLIDPVFLESLPEREIRSGLAETIKYGVISDEKIFEIFEQSTDQRIGEAVIVKVIARCAEIKARYVEKDEHDNQGIRAALNYGHTTGHAIETLTDHAINHGEGIAIGMGVAARLSLKLGLVDLELILRQDKLLSKIGLPVKVPEINPEQIVQVMRRDKKAEEGRIRFVLPTGIGKEPTLKYLDESQIIAALEESK